MRIINTDDKCKTYFKNGKKLYDSYTFKNINEFNIESEPDNKNKNINYKEINNKMISILSQINPKKKKNIKLMVNNFFII